MDIIEALSDMIEDEIRDAEKYARCALNHKDEDPALAKVFHDLSVEEKSHMDRLYRMEQEKVERLQAMYME